MIGLSIVTCGLSMLEIERTLESVKLFRNKNPQIKLEHIVVCPRLIHNDSRIDTLVEDEGNGIYEAFNLGIMNASLDFIQILNAGDTLRNVEIGQIDMSVDFQLFPIMAGGKLKSPRLNRIRTYGSSIPHPGMWVKREKYASLGLYRTDIPVVADFCWVYKNIASIEKSNYLHAEAALVNFELDGVSSNFEIIRHYFRGLRLIEKRKPKVYFFTFIKLLSFVKWTMSK